LSVGTIFVRDFEVARSIHPFKYRTQEVHK
jgi:hypothetical protein